jgi:hypothetical protein
MAISCPSCSSDSYLEIESIDQGRYGTIECRSCGLIYHYQRYIYGNIKYLTEAQYEIFHKKFSAPPKPRKPKAAKTYSLRDICVIIGCSYNYLWKMRIDGAIPKSDCGTSYSEELANKIIDQVEQIHLKRKHLEHHVSQKEIDQVWKYIEGVSGIGCK